MTSSTVTSEPQSGAMNGAKADSGSGLTSPNAIARAETEADTVVAPCTAFAGEINKIWHPRLALPLTVKGDSFGYPIWDKSFNEKIPPLMESWHPIAYPTRSGSDLEMEVEIDVLKAEGLSGMSTLRGRLGNCEWVGQFPSRVGNFPVKVRLAAATTKLEAHCGDIFWRADVPGCGSHIVGRTRVEIYRISEYLNPAFLSDGRPAEALRFLYRKIDVAGIDVANAGGLSKATEMITKYLHSSHGLKYDSAGGGEAHYAVGWPWSSKKFELTEYLIKGNGSVVNCYDQAAAILVLCAILGIDGFTRFVQPFGFVKPTLLVGGDKKTNSPFYERYHPNNISVDRFSFCRKPFGNHQFFILRETSKVYDACAGPALGTDEYMPYLEKAVDMEVDQRGRPNPDFSEKYKWAWSLNITGQKIDEESIGFSDDFWEVSSIS